MSEPLMQPCVLRDKDGSLVTRGEYPTEAARPGAVALFESKTYAYAGAQEGELIFVEVTP